MSKILKNTTGSDIDLDVSGLRIPASGQITVDETQYLLLASADSITELTTPINSGDIIVNDGTADLSASEGLAYIQYPDDEANIRFDNSTNDFDADEGQGAIEEARNTIYRKMFTMAFFSDGIVFGTDYLSYMDALATSDQIPAVVPFNCELIAITYSNEDSGTDFTIDIRAANYNSGSSDTSRLTVSGTNFRTAAWSNFTRPTFNAGDKIAVTISDNGTNPDEPRVLLYFQTTDDTLQNISENYSGDF